MVNYLMECLELLRLIKGKNYSNPGTVVKNNILKEHLNM